MESSLPDRVLVLAAQEGSSRAVAALYERYYDALRRLLFARVREHEIACDIAQDAFLRAIPRLAQLRDGNAFRSWLYAIGLRLLTSELQRQRHPLRQTEQLTAVDHHQSSGELQQVNIVDRLATQQLVFLVLESLTDGDCQVLCLRHLGGCTARETADILGISSAAAQRRLNRAEARFVAQYQELERSELRPSTDHALAREGVASVQ